MLCGTWLLPTTTVTCMPHAVNCMIAHALNGYPLTAFIIIMIDHT